MRIDTTYNWAVLSPSTGGARRIVESGRSETPQDAVEEMKGVLRRQAAGGEYKCTLARFGRTLSAATIWVPTTFNEAARSMLDDAASGKLRQTYHHGGNPQ